MLEERHLQEPSLVLGVGYTEEKANSPGNEIIRRIFISNIYVEHNMY